MIKIKREDLEVGQKWLLLVDSGHVSEPLEIFNLTDKTVSIGRKNKWFTLSPYPIRTYMIDRLEWVERVE